jgi:hypothetical protein
VSNVLPQLFEFNKIPLPQNFSNEVIKKKTNFDMQHGIDSSMIFLIEPKV